MYYHYAVSTECTLSAGSGAKAQALTQHQDGQLGGVLQAFRLTATCQAHPQPRPVHQCWRHPQTSQYVSYPGVIEPRFAVAEYL